MMNSSLEYAVDGGRCLEILLSLMGFSSEYIYSVDGSEQLIMLAPLYRNVALTSSFLIRNDNTGTLEK